MIPRGMSPSRVIKYFKDAGIRVMLSIGGITYTDDWDAALATSPTQLGLNAADVARDLGVGIEIDYENSSSPNIEALAAFIAAYRSCTALRSNGQQSRGAPDDRRRRRRSLADRPQPPCDPVLAAAR